MSRSSARAFSRGRSAPAGARITGTPAGLALSLRRVGTIPVLLVEGEIDLATAPALEREALHALRDAHGRFILDLSATTFMDLSGARAAARLARHARALGGQLALVVVTPGVRLALRLVPPRDAILTRRLSTAAQALVDLQP